MEEREPRVEIKEGESAAITCKAKGKPPPTYTWIKAATREVNAISILCSSWNKLKTFFRSLIQYFIYRI